MTKAEKDAMSEDDEQLDVDEDPEVDEANAALDEGETGFFARHMDGTMMWHEGPDSDTCGGSGYYRCYCGGDFCVCGNRGEIECDGCDDCRPTDDEDEEPDHA